MSTEYKITTIQDIFEKVPANKIPLCCKELGELLASNKAILEAASIMAGLQGNPDCATLIKGCQFKYPITWIDDDKGTIDTTISVEDEEIAQISISGDGQIELKEKK